MHNFFGHSLLKVDNLAPKLAGIGWLMGVVANAWIEFGLAPGCAFKNWESRWGRHMLLLGYPQ